MAKAAPTPESDVQAELNRQLTAAEQVDAAYTGAPAMTTLSAQVSSGAAPVNIALGQSEDNIKAALGQPVTVIDLGPRGKIYRYKDMKITFKAGKVADVQ
jgi:hypothetical protein